MIFGNYVFFLSEKNRICEKNYVRVEKFVKIMTFFWRRTEVGIIQERRRAKINFQTFMKLYLLNFIFKIL